MMNIERRMICFVLLRKETASFIFSLVQHAPSKPVFETGGNAVTIKEVTDTIQTSCNYMVPTKWNIHSENIIPPKCSLRHQGLGLSIPQPYAWSITPWGCDYTGLMIAIVTSESHFNKVIDANVEIRQWVLSTYYEDTLSSAVLRGMVLARRAEERGKDIFNVLNKQSSVLVLRWDQYDLRSPNDYPDIVESCNTKDNPKLRIAWIRVNNQAEFHDLTRTSLLHHFGLFVTGDIDPRHRREALLSYPDGWGDSDALNDPLRFGIKALESASCIYIPATEKDRKEIFLMNTMFTANTLARELNSVIPAVECVF